MVKELLVEFARKSGSELMEKLDQNNVVITDAFWRWSTVDEIWKLYMATPVAEISVLKAIGLISPVVNQLPTYEGMRLDTTDTFITYAAFPVIEQVRKQYGTVLTPPNERYFPRTFHEREVYIFRLNRPPVPTATAQQPLSAQGTTHA